MLLMQNLKIYFLLSIRIHRLNRMDKIEFYVRRKRTDKGGV